LNLLDQANFLSFIGLFGAVIPVVQPGRPAGEDVDWSKSSVSSLNPLRPHLGAHLADCYHLIDSSSSLHMVIAGEFYCTGGIGDGLSVLINLAASGKYYLVAVTFIAACSSWP
jgi:hypothetical protein